MPLFEYNHGLALDIIDIGQGPPVFLVHSAGMGAAQWRALMREMGADFRCLAPNLRGYGRSAPWPEGEPASLAAEIELLEAALARFEGKFELVGHSMGAWLALEIALRHSARIATLALIEPVVLGTLRAPGEEAAFAEVKTMIDDVLAAFARGSTAAATERFTDYWYGPGAWAKIPLAQRLPIFARAGKMRADVAAVSDDRTAAARYAALDLPALVLSAERTTPAARRMAEIVAGALPQARLEILAGAGHMAPVTDAAAVAARLRRFWDRAPSGAPLRG